MPDQNGRLAGRSTHTAVVKLALWVLDRDDFKATPPTIAKVIADYRVATGNTLAAGTVKTVFESLELPLTRKRAIMQARTNRMDRLIREVYKLSKRLDHLIAVVGAEDTVESGTTEGLQALYGHRADPDAPSVEDADG